ncbi:hypothetical protein CYMTET_4432 [Cymbomonas tetramitiformis]|uniref:Uncharacterized protein n=1 Tax=Cymbomonas tetramitiformis TaxID=36881 RepID=A0AAE0LK17_9CHLO|nr:hypothetical protein CYMTET_4432 [Cymbomonas tetramitiformis]
MEKADPGIAHLIAAKARSEECRSFRPPNPEVSTAKLCNTREEVAAASATVTRGDTKEVMRIAREAIAATSVIVTQGETTESMLIGCAKVR